jgi:site-specific recombinase XerD
LIKSEERNQPSNDADSAAFGPLAETPIASHGSIPATELERDWRDWLYDCEYRQCSPQTLAIRRFLGEKLVWFLREQGYTTCGLPELRRFLTYCGSGHASASGRWGNARMTKPVRPRTIHTYHGHLRTFYRWAVKEELVAQSPMERIAPPVHRADQIAPFTQQQVTALMAAAKRSRHHRRDEAILTLMLDTGLRASELCGLRMKDIDLDGHRLEVLGKGNKKRTVFYGKTTARALWQHIRDHRPEPDEPIFSSDPSAGAGEPLTRSGLLQLFQRLGKAASIQATRCSPHTARHTFAVEFLRAGGNVLALQHILGHTNLQMSQRYVALASADIEQQQRRFSPADRLKARE